MSCSRIIFSNLRWCPTYSSSFVTCKLRSCFKDGNSILSKNRYTVFDTSLLKIISIEVRIFYRRPKGRGKIFEIIFEFEFLETAFWRNKYSSTKNRSSIPRSGRASQLVWRYRELVADHPRILDASWKRKWCVQHPLSIVSFAPERKWVTNFFYAITSPYTALPHNATLHHCTLPPSHVPSNRSPLSTGLP